MLLARLPLKGTHALVTSNGLLGVSCPQLLIMCFKISVRSLSIPVFPQAAKRGLLSPGRGRGVHTRGRGSALRARGRGSRGRGRGVPMHAVVDHRPRALEISGFTEADHVDLLPHFAVSQPKTTLLRLEGLISAIEPI